VHVTAAELEFPANRDTPIAARIAFSGNISADFDWRQEGPQTWDIVVETDGGLLELKMGGNRLFIDGREVAGEDTIMGEYPKLYARMAELVRAGQSEVDLAPMVHVADALTLGKRVVTDAFHF
jgi:D-galactose 1-dehydrogenase